MHRVLAVTFTSTRSFSLKTSFFMSVAILAITLASSNVSAAPSSSPTSVDLYCETMVTTTIETSLRLRTKPLSQEKLKKASELEAEMLALCKATPAVGQAKLQSEMSAQEFRIVSCVAMAEGITNAYKKSEYESVEKLSEGRAFAANACASNESKAFLNDLNRFGPDYVKGRQY